MSITVMEPGPDQRKAIVDRQTSVAVAIAVAVAVVALSQVSGY